MTINISAFTFDEEEARVIALAVTTYAACLTAAEAKPDRQRKKVRNLEKKLQVLDTVGVHFTQAPTCGQLCEALSRQVQGWTEDKRNALLIDVAFSDPFSPYQLETSEKDKREQLGVLCGAIGLAAKRSDQVLDAIADARKAHRNIAWGKVATSALLGAIVLAAGGYVAAPLIAAQLGAAAGLGGAAAVSHGLALLGGG